MEPRSSWTQYLLQKERMTQADREIIEQAEALHVGPNPPEIRIHLGVNKKLLSHKHMQQKGLLCRRMIRIHADSALGGG